MFIIIVCIFLWTVYKIAQYNFKTMVRNYKKKFPERVKVSDDKIKEAIDKVIKGITVYHCLLLYLVWVLINNFSLFIFQAAQSEVQQKMLE